jgi:hypothetical protein
MLLVPTAGAVYRAFAGYSEWEMRPVLEYVLERQEPGDAVVAFKGSDSEMLYYQKAYGYAPERYVKFGKLPRDEEDYLPELRAVFREHGPRVWFIFGHHEKSYHREILFEVLDSIAVQRDGIEIRRTAAYLYEAKTSAGDDPLEPEESNATE